MTSNLLTISSRKGRRTQRGNATAEFGPALMVFLLLVLFPLFDLGALAAGMATVYLIAKQSASRAGTAATYGDAQQLAAQESLNISTTGLGRFLNLQPQGGIVYNGANSGVSLYVQATDINSNAVTTYGPNTVVPGPINPSGDVYEYTSSVNFKVGPLLNMSAMPLIGSVPGIGAPAQVTIVAQSAAEYPEGLIASSVTPASLAGGGTGGGGTGGTGGGGTGGTGGGGTGGGGSGTGGPSGPVMGSPAVTPAATPAARAAAATHAGS